MTDGNGRDDERDLARVARGIALIVVAGATLGLAHNALGLASRPPRGLAWIHREEAPASLEALQLRPVVSPADTAVRAGDPAAASAAAAPAAEDLAKKPKSKGKEQPAGAAPAPAPASPPAKAAPAAADLPAIPDLDKPIQVELATFKRLYDAQACVVVDAREVEEYADGHIAGALNLPYNDAMAEPERMTKLGENGRPIVVYCGGGSCELSMDLAKWMLQNGRKRVLVYLGGWNEWKGTGYPVASGKAPK